MIHNLLDETENIRLDGGKGLGLVGGVPVLDSGTGIPYSSLLVSFASSNLARTCTSLLSYPFFFNMLLSISKMLWFLLPSHANLFGTLGTVQLSPYVFFFLHQLQDGMEKCTITISS